MFVLSGFWSGLVCSRWDPDGHAPLPNGQFSASSSGSWMQSLSVGGGGCVERGAWHVSWKLQVFGRGLSGRSYLIEGGLSGLSLGHWASDQGEASIQPRVQPHSCGLQGPQPPPFRLFILCSAGPKPHRQVVRAGSVSCFPLLWTGTERLREGQRQRQAARGTDRRHGDPGQGGWQAANRTDVPARRKQSWGGALEGSLPPPLEVLVVLTSLIKRPLAQLNWLVNRNCL